jgi:methylglyoxal reductase
VRYVKLGSTDMKVSVVAFGAWAAGGHWWGGNDEKDSIEAIQASIDAGVNFIDTAPAYGQGLSEEIVAKAVKGKRESVFIATKCGLRWNLKKGVYFFDYDPGVPIYRYLGKESLEEELDNSLKRLNTDYIDLYQTHWQDPTTPIGQTMEFLMEAKHKGKIRAIGVSNANLQQIKEYRANGVLDADQEKYSLIDLEVQEELLPWCEKNNVSMLAYSPAAKGLLTGKLTPQRKFSEGDLRNGDHEYSPENIFRINALTDKYLKPVAQKHNAEIGNIAIAWLIGNPSVIALCGARNKKQALENAAAGDILIDGDDKAKVESFIKEAVN